MKHTTGLNIVADTLTKVIEIPTGYKASVSNFFASNQQGNNKYITVYWQHAHDANHKIYIVKEYVITANNYLQFSDNMVMQSGDSIWVLTDVGSAMSVIVSYDLYKENTVPFMAD